MSSYVNYFTKEMMKNTDGSKLARKFVRTKLKKEYAQMNAGSPSKIAEMKLPSRKERREEARKNKVAFKPIKND